MAYVKSKTLTAGEICKFTLLWFAARFKFKSALFVLHLASIEVPTRARAYSSQGQGRAQIVVELKPELPFEIVRGSEGGAVREWRLSGPS
jgi:hypothetical protein